MDGGRENKQSTINQPTHPLPHQSYTHTQRDTARHEKRCGTNHPPVPARFFVFAGSSQGMEGMTRIINLSDQGGGFGGGGGSSSKDNKLEDMLESLRNRLPGGLPGGIGGTGAGR